jgi:hypothetical protein
MCYPLPPMKSIEDAEDCGIIYERALIAAAAGPTGNGPAAIWRAMLANEIVFAVWPGEGAGEHYFMPLKGGGLIRKTIREGRTLHARISGVMFRDVGQAIAMQLASTRNRFSIVVANDDPTRPAA